MRSQLWRFLDHSLHLVVLSNFRPVTALRFLWVNHMISQGPCMLMTQVSMRHSQIPLLRVLQPILYQQEVLLKRRVQEPVKQMFEWQLPIHLNPLISNSELVVSSILTRRLGFQTRCIWDITLDVAQLLPRVLLLHANFPLWQHSRFQPSLPKRHLLQRLPLKTIVPTMFWAQVMVSLHFNS